MHVIECNQTPAMWSTVCRSLIRNHILKQLRSILKISKTERINIGAWTYTKFVPKRFCKRDVDIVPLLSMIRRNHFLFISMRTYLFWRNVNRTTDLLRIKEIMLFSLCARNCIKSIKPSNCFELKIVNHNAWLHLCRPLKNFRKSFASKP